MADVIAALEARAESVLTLKRNSRPRNPLILEFCGSPKAGKTSAINALAIFLRRNGFTVKVVTERASVCPIADKKDWLFNVWTSCSAITGIVPNFRTDPGELDVLICDRGIFDALCWFRWLQTQERLQNDEYDSLIHFLCLRRFRAAIDLIYVFTASPEVSIKREYSYLLTRKQGSIMNPATLQSYNEAIGATVQQFSGRFRSIKEIDTTVLDQNEVGSQVTNNVLEELSAITEERVGFLPASVIPTSSTFTWSELMSSVGSQPVAFDLRTKVESDVSKVQPLPIAVITDPKHENVLVFRKAERSLERTSPERRKTLPWAGGHIRQEDAFDLAEADLLVLSRAALLRELREELGFDLTPTQAEPFCIWHRAWGTDRSAQHMAVCFICEMDLENLRLSLDKYEFVQPSKDSISGRVLRVPEVADEDLESWGRVILRHVFGIDGGQLTFLQ